MSAKEEILAAVGDLPRWRLAFAYGSGVVAQRRQRDDRMLDVMVVVDDPLAWHRENLVLHASHYSMLGHLGARAVTAVQETGPGVYFNTHVPLGAGGTWRRMKYGVVSTRAFLEDLSTWRWLYVAGRLHKPVIFLGDDDAELAEAMRTNLHSALVSALFLLPTAFDEGRLFETVASLSYEGDVRFAVGAENPHKVAAIVEPNISRFADHFQATIRDAPELVAKRGSGIFEQSHQITLGMLPASLRLAVPSTVEEAPGRLRATLRRLVRLSSATQSAKGLLTAGPLRSALYLAAKFQRGALR